MKLKLFEYFLKQLVEWYCDYYNISVVDFNNHPKNDLSKIKIIKLHFFACSTDDEALDLFDSFHAMPYGHVESFIYKNLAELEHFKVDNFRLKLITDLDKVIGDTLQHNAVVDRIVTNLKAKNRDFISLEPFDLVDLSHKWFSWNFTFHQARKAGMFSKAISPSLIKQETKSYSY
jgi:hypothetical protein